MIIAILALVGLVGGFIAGWFDDGPTLGFAGALAGTLLGAILGTILMAIFNPAFFN